MNQIEEAEEVIGDAARENVSAINRRLRRRRQCELDCVQENSIAGIKKKYLQNVP